MLAVDGGGGVDDPEAGGVHLVDLPGPRGPGGGGAIGAAGEGGGILDGIGGGEGGADGVAGAGPGSRRRDRSWRDGRWRGEEVAGGGVF